MKTPPSGLCLYFYWGFCLIIFTMLNTKQWSLFPGLKKKKFFHCLSHEFLSNILYSQGFSTYFIPSPISGSFGIFRICPQITIYTHSSSPWALWIYPYQPNFRLFERWHQLSEIISCYKPCWASLNYFITLVAKEWKCEAHICVSMNNYFSGQVPNFV